MHLVMLYALIALAVVCICNSIAIICLSRRLRSRGMSYQDLKRYLKSASAVQDFMQRNAAAGAKMSENYRQNWNLLSYGKDSTV